MSKATERDLDRARRAIAGKDYGEAAALLRPIAEEGCAEALYWLAWLHEGGYGISFTASS